ncbi:hypothetical protein QR98_0098310 [Sarcoptes scabiei]|uniref:Uncharacterized protein n=1 Tax=Sarcoptes scabiei TaxID=52283 RepID=A0A132AJW1_SARSC|nr:hypothetical protein QR98_0098310 [Sarcoptes scabiei]
MVVCRFFQNGYCKFGNQCRFEHSYPNNQNVFNDNRGLFLMQRILVLVLKKLTIEFQAILLKHQVFSGTMDSVTLKHFFREASKRIQQISVSIKL